MKRCSQCDFVYEDDQARCDMDGGELVYEPTLYPAAETAMVVAQPPMKLRSRSFILTAAATVIMGSVLGIGFFGFSDRSQSSASPAPAAGPASVPPSIVKPAMAATSSETTSSSEATPSTHKSTEAPAANVKSRNATATASASSSTKPAPAASRSPVPRETRSAPTKREDDSKVGSLLKKTGRILKKPFRKW